MPLAYSIVPIAPSKTWIRSDSSMFLKGSMTTHLVLGLRALAFENQARCQFYKIEPRPKAEDPRPKEKIPRQTTRDFRVAEVYSGLSFRACPSCLAVCFTWPQVALTHHVFHLCLYAAGIRTVKQRCSLKVQCPTSKVQCQ